jgi:sulfate transport system substrate-binding protein
MNTRLRQVFLGVLLAGGALISVAHANTNQLLNVSYDPTREFYDDFNKSFAGFWKSKTNQEINVKQSHGGSGKQARSVIDGLEADVVTLALAYDIDAIADKGKLLPKNWQARLPNNSAPYTSTIVFLVRKGNPKGIKDWADLVKPNVEIVTPNPKTSGGARWNYLAAWGWAKQQPNGSDATARQFVQKIFAQTKVLDSGARGALTTFAERGIGDVLIAWENEAYLATRDLEPGAFEVVVPSVSILAEPSVALVDKNVDKHNTRSLATGYLNYLYSPIGQELAAKHYFRPRNPEIAKKYQSKFAPVNLFTIDQAFGGWRNAQKVHFDDGGIFDQIVSANRQR